MESNGGYRDVTKEWLNNAKPNSHRVFKRKYYLHDGIKYKIDGKKVVLDYSAEEKIMAEWLVKIFGGVIYLIPRINEPLGIQTADYYFKKEYWDLKSISGNSSSTIDRAINGKKRQSKNFIIDISKSEMTINEADNYINKLYQSKYRFWVKKIILVKNNRLIKIYERK